MVVENKPADAALLKWMQEVTALLCYQPEVPASHKVDLVEALSNYMEAAKKP